jgi:acetoin utilization deacetylase AcuC-like enzyme
VHDAAFVEAVRTGQPHALAQSQGFRWSHGFANAVARIWSGHIAACRLALGEGMVLHPVSGAHHAGFARGSGFCTFNYLVGAALTLLSDGLECVAIVDLDAHPGDGTFELARRNRPRRTATGRLLARPETDPRAAAIALFDIAGGRWCDADDEDGVEYLVARDAEEYRSALDRLPGFLDRVRPQLVQYQAGMDPFEGDGGGGVDGVNEAFLAERDRFVIEQIRSRGIPLVVNLAGGYVRGVSERLHVNTVRIMASAA